MSMWGIFSQPFLLFITISTLSRYPLNLEPEELSHLSQFIHLRHSPGVSLHLFPGVPLALLPVQGVQVAVDIGRGGREDPLWIPLEGLINNIARAMNILRCDL